MLPMMRLVLTCLFLAAFACPLEAETVLVGKYPAKIVPEQVAMLSLSERGTITDLTDASQRLEKGTVVAVLNKQRTADEREEMELQIARERISKRDEMQKLKAQRRKIQFFLSLSDEERKYNVDFAESDVEPSEESLKDVDERLELLERELRTMERRKRVEFDNKHDPYTLRMPFTGLLQYNVPLPEDLSQPMEYNPGVTQGFATVCDDSAFYITLSISSSDLSLLPEENFSTSISLPGGRQLKGTYSHRRVEHAGAERDMLVYFFKLPEQDHETAYKMLGSNSSASLFYEAEGDVVMVSKAEILKRPEAAECESWQQLVSRLYADCHILLIAERDIVLVKNAP